MAVLLSLPKFRHVQRIHYHRYAAFIAILKKIADQVNILYTFLMSQLPHKLLLKVLQFPHPAAGGNKKNLK